MRRIDEVLERARKVLKNQFPKLCVEAGLPNLEIIDTAPDVAVDEFTMGIYLASPSGEVYEYDYNRGIEKLSITIDLVVNRKVSNSSLPEQYLSLLVAFLLTKTFGYASYVAEALTSRVDIDCPANAMVCQLISIVNIHNDSTV